MGISKEESHLQGLAQLMVGENLLKKEKAQEYQSLAQKNKQSLLQYLIANHILDPKQTAWVIAQNFGVPLIDLDAVDPKNMPITLVNEKLIHRHGVLPLYTHGNHLFVAIDDPCKQASLKEIQFHTGLSTSAVVVESQKLTTLIHKILQEQEAKGLANYVNDAPSGDLQDEEAPLVGTETAQADDPPIVKFVNKILLEAIQRKVSDIHCEPYEQTYRIRYRLDGILTEIATPPANLASRITSRIKVMANLDISERRIPQDGRFKMSITKDHAIDFRISTCPTTGGEKVVMRILDSGASQLGVEALGLSVFQKAHFVKAISKPQGMILVTGPTGSGKTVTLYTALNRLNTVEVNISTAEDPVEIKIPGINQVNVNPKAGLTFSRALRSFLRQDPDIIMVGEIRDLETAEIAITAAQTGHMVLSTVHTNSASETLTRLLNMGIPSFNIASSITLIIAQRLARKLCDTCKVIRTDVTPKSLCELGFGKTEEEVRALQLYKAVGCTACTRGYRGRIGLFEVLPMSKKIGELIMTGQNSLDILHQAQSDGMLTIYESGLEAIKAGITTIEEVNRVTVE